MTDTDDIPYGWIPGATGHQTTVPGRTPIAGDKWLHLAYTKDRLRISRERLLPTYSFGSTIVC
ncbi:MAG: hypothetical protein MUQ10_00700 [Anaerolineae bacterium]|nr:hypothetical protein [Anaerolineae bacterium]